MAEEVDFNDVLEGIFLSEETQKQASYQEGYKAGTEAGNPEGYHLGYHRGAELGREIGFYLGTVKHYLEANEKSETKYSEKILAQLQKVQELINAFPHTNSEEDDILAMAEVIRAQYKKACSLLKIPSLHPFEINTMEATAHKIQQRLDSIITYLTPLLPIANSHMVEFFTRSHWETLVPVGLRNLLDDWDLNYAVEKFWHSAGCNRSENNELTKWINTARSHCLAIDNEYCLSRQQLQNRIRAKGGTIMPEIKVKDFMTGKKSYEVQTMSHLVASLHEASKSTHCVEAGGGRGHLLVALSLGYGIPSLTVDCDNQTLTNAVGRVKKIQKQWHAIAKKIDDGVERPLAETNNSKHRFAVAYVTPATDFTAIVKEKFPEHTGDVGVLLTGLHTCGNLGPDSLRIFASQSSTPAMLTVPCCFHLLSEDNSCNGSPGSQGFPMSRHLKGYKLGRNARMLASQSLERVVAQRQMPSESLLYRALLQAIIKEHLPNYSPAEGKLKRIAPKCQNFEEYFKMADKVLKLGIFDSLPDSYLTNVHRNISCQRKKIVLFYLLRMCLAQVVENVILLDRLLFLIEQGFQNAYLVKLFDPVLSPRCHSIVAIR